jgi:glycosyltransferase involved in cell wall biosynthesis
MIIYYISAVDLSNYDAQRTHVLEVVSQLNQSSIDITLFTPLFKKKHEYFEFKHFYIPVLLKKSKLKFIEYEISLCFVLLWHIFSKKPDIIYVRKGFLTIIPTIIAKLFKIKCILEINGFLQDELKLSFNLPQFIIRLFSYIEKYNLQWSDKIITVTEGIKELLSQIYKIESGKITVIANGVNTTKFFPKENKNDKEYQLGFVGNLVTWSGLEYLIQSLPKICTEIKNIKLLIVGDGTQKVYLQNLAKDQKVSEYIKFTGFVLPSDIPEYINQCHICYLPAIKLRNARIGISPIKLYEYLACGVPVIVTDIEGLTFISEHQLGLVVEPEDSNALVHATLELLKNSELRKKMSKNARSYIENHFTWKITTQKIIIICKQLLGQYSQV